MIKLKKKSKRRRRRKIELLEDKIFKKIQLKNDPKI
jgi:hypothetical protein